MSDLPRQRGPGGAAVALRVLGQPGHHPPQLPGALAVRLQHQLLRAVPLPVQRAEEVALPAGGRSRSAQPLAALHPELDRPLLCPLQWLQNPSLRQEKRTLFGDMVCFLLITPLATISGWLCLRGAIDHLHFSSRLEAVGLIALTVALFTIYLFWTLVRKSTPAC